MTLLIAGTIGTRLTADLAAHEIPLRLFDRRPVPEPPPGADVVQADLRDQAAVAKAVAGTSADIHLAGLTQERPFAETVSTQRTRHRATWLSGPRRKSFGGWRPGSAR